MTGIIREPTPDDLAPRDSTDTVMIPIHTPRGKVLSPNDKLNKRISDEKQKAAKSGLPFALASLRADIKDAQEEFQNAWKRRGFIDKDIKLPKIDWQKYSDLKNFEVIDEGSVMDRYLSKVHRRPVFVKYIKYKFKGFSNTYNIMESEESAVMRADDAADKRTSSRSINESETKAVQEE